VNALFIQNQDPECGVFQMGWNLFQILNESQRIRWEYYDLPTTPPLNVLRRFDVLLYNWSPLIGGWISAAPLAIPPRQFSICHGEPMDESKWDGILFPGETAPLTGKWHAIGRPLPHYIPTPVYLHVEQPIIGVHGFMGAWADGVVKLVLEQFERATVRLHLPFSKFCDPFGVQATTMANLCRDMVLGSGVKLDISHDFLPQSKLLDWLAQNDLNCYVRPADMIWRGVSSAPDCALAARKPIGVSRCNAFRHLHGLSPSICVEDHTLTEIISDGLSPLIPLYQRWLDETVRSEVESVLLADACKGA
jgi:hypothetical protein